MKKYLLSLLLLFLPLTASASSQFTDDLTSVENGTCIEDSHQGSNDCTRAFYGVNGQQIYYAGNYWQNDTGTGHYLGFKFNSIKTIARYTLLNVHADSNFYIRAWKFVAVTGTGEVILDQQTEQSFLAGVMKTINIANPIPAYEYRLYVTLPGVSGTLLTQLQMQEAESPERLYLPTSQTGATLLLGKQSNDGTYWADPSAVSYLFVSCILAGILFFTLIIVHKWAFRIGYYITTNGKKIGKN